MQRWCSLMVLGLAVLIFTDSVHAYRPMKDLGRSSRVNIINWAWNHRRLQHTRVERYTRDKHFERWVDEDGDCQDARQEVLIRDSYQPPQMLNRCRVASGKWRTPYSDFTLHDPRDLEVDHVVPLFNAYYNGAAHWTQAKRCHFQNFLGYPGHLLAVEALTNTLKSALSPSSWMPENQAFRCEYLKHWVMIKVIWKLTFPVKEFKGVLDVLKREECPKAMFRVLKREILHYRSLAKQISGKCSRK